MRIEDHFELSYDKNAGVDNLTCFAPEVHFLEKVKAARWPHWSELFRLCLAVMKESYSAEELADDFGPAEFLIFEKILRGGFGRFQKRRPGVRVPEVFMYAVGELARQRKASQRPSTVTT